MRKFIFQFILFFVKWFYFVLFHTFFHHLQLLNIQLKAQLVCVFIKIVFEQTEIPN